MIEERHRKAIASLDSMRKSGSYFLFNDTVEYKVTKVYTKGDSCYIEVEDRAGRFLVLDKEFERLPGFVLKFAPVDDMNLRPVEYDNKGWYRKLNDDEGVVWSKGRPFACFVFSSAFCKKERIDDTWYLEIHEEVGTENVVLFRGTKSHRRKIIKKSRDRFGFPTCTMQDLFKYDVYKVEIKDFHGKKCYKLIPQKER